MGYLCRGQFWVTVRSAARSAGKRFWGICTAVSVGSQSVVARFARRHLLWSICAAVSVGSQRIGSEYIVARFARKH